MIKRYLEDIILRQLFKNKTIVIFGARQVGKTTLVNEIVNKLDARTLFLNCDEADIRELLSEVNASKLKPLFYGYQIVVIDEAQRIPNAGLTIKIIHDSFKNIQLIVTGSSSLELASSIREPMTGRISGFLLHPLSFSEMAASNGLLQEKRMLEYRMIFGWYPDVITHTGEDIKILRSLATDYLYKDLLAIGNIKKPFLLDKLLKALALQIGNEVSFNELAQLTSSDTGTIEKYIDLLEKSYIIFRLHGLNRNVRNEIKKGKKIYFCDNGIRNAVLSNFQSVNSRVDAGVLWENLLVSERFKLISNKDHMTRCYFWRTTQQQEIDFVEELNNKLTAFEFKLNPSRRSFLSKTFSKAYPGTGFKVITPANAEEFIGDQVAGE